MLTLQYVPYQEIEDLTTEQRVRKLLSLVKTEKIILMEGQLEAHEEAKLIERTMELINKTFKGIEICTVYPQSKSLQFSKKVRRGLLHALGHKPGLTIIGPATIVREIKKDPNKIELLTVNKRNRRKT